MPLSKKARDDSDLKNCHRTAVRYAQQCGNNAHFTIVMVWQSVTMESISVCHQPQNTQR